MFIINPFTSEMSKYMVHLSKDLTFKFNGNFYGDMD